MTDAERLVLQSDYMNQLEDRHRRAMAELREKYEWEIRLLRAQNERLLQALIAPAMLQPRTPALISPLQYP
jgi:hypothetical protein